MQTYGSPVMDRYVNFALAVPWDTCFGPVKRCCRRKLGNCLRRLLIVRRNMKPFFPVFDYASSTFDASHNTTALS
jgi:hypothetical protein